MVILILIKDRVSVSWVRVEVRVRVWVKVSVSVRVILILIKDRVFVSWRVGSNIAGKERAGGINADTSADFDIRMREPRRKHEAEEMCKASLHKKSLLQKFQISAPPVQVARSQSKVRLEHFILLFNSFVEMHRI